MSGEEEENAAELKIGDGKRFFFGYLMFDALIIVIVPKVYAFCTILGFLSEKKPPR